MRIAKIVGLGIVVVVAGAYALQWAGFGHLVGAEKPIAVPASCPVVPVFPPGAEQMGQISPRVARDATFETVRVRRDPAEFSLMCGCSDSVDWKSEFVTSPGARDFVRSIVETPNRNLDSLVTRADSTAPGWDAAVTARNQSTLWRYRTVIQGKCFAMGSAFEPNGRDEATRTTTDRWFASWRFRDGSPVELPPMPESWRERSLRLP